MTTEGHIQVTFTANYLVQTQHKQNLRLCCLFPLKSRGTLVATSRGFLFVCFCLFVHFNVSQVAWNMISKQPQGYPHLAMVEQSSIRIPARIWTDTKHFSH